MRRVIDWIITAVAYMIMFATLDSLNVEWRDWQFCSIALSMFLFSLYSYADGLFRWSSGPHNHTP